MTDHQAAFDRLAAEVDEWRAELGVPGATFGIHIDGQDFSGGSGVTHVEHPVPVNDETLFQIGSITKTVTATAMMRLVEQGKLDLQQRVRTYLPQFRVADEDVSERVTVWHLLTHLAGWTGDVFTDTGNNDDAAQKYVEGMADFEQLAPLGTHFSYNNAAFAVAGRVIEVVTGATFEAAIHELIFEPLDMQHSFFFPHQVMLHRFAVGHQVEEAEGDKKTTVLEPWAISRGMNAAGGISCHIGDLLRYGVFHLGEGPPLLRGESFQYMHRRQTRSLPYLGWCGLAWMLSDVDGVAMHWHTGGTNGQNAVLALLPDKQLALGMMTNGDKGGALHECFRKAVLSEFCGIEIKEPQAVESTREELAQYAGMYRGTMREIELRMDDGTLVADIRMEGGLPSGRPPVNVPPAALASCESDQLLVLDGDYKGTRADFLRDEAGNISYMRFGSRITVRQ